VTGGLRYIPAPDAFGFDVMAYAVCDATGICGEAVVTVEIEAVSDAPVAVDDAFTGVRNSALSIDLLANDYDPDGGSPVLVGTSPVTALGGMVFCGTACVYLPPTPWTGPDSFTYTIVDAEGLTATAAVTITPDVADVVLYMRGAGPGDQVASPVLPLSADPGPANDELPNFDTDRDDNPGLFLLRVDGGVGVQIAETDPARYQIWSLAAERDLTLEGLGELNLWAATSQFQPDIRARVQVFLLDCPGETTNGTECREMGRAFADRRPWTFTPGAWQNATIDFGDVVDVIPAGHTFAIKLTVAGPNSDDDMHFAFDAAGLSMSFSVILAPTG